MQTTKTKTEWRNELSRDEVIDGLVERVARRIGDHDGALRAVVERAYADDSAVTVSEVVEIVEAQLEGIA